MKANDFVRSHLADLVGFDPAEPLEVMAAKAGIPEERIIRLNANENPYGPSPRVAEALASIKPNIYPDPLQRTVRRALADFTGFDPDQIVVGAGSDEIIDLLFRLVVKPGDSIVECSPTFGMYSFGARLAGAECRSVPRDDRFEIDLEATLAAVDPTTKIVFLTSPNNPTGDMAGYKQIRALVETGALVVVDEAYFEYAGESCADLVSEHENLVVLRTFSKWAALAGLRVGYGIMSPTLVKYLLNIKQPYNVNVAAEAALLVSLDDADYLLGNVELVVNERERVFSALNGIRGIGPRPSRGNYVLFEVPPGRANEIYEGLAAKGIFLRRFGHPRLKDFIRTSIGTPEQTDALLGALRELV